MKFGTIRQTVMIDAEPLKVYEAFVEPEKHSAFTGAAASGTARKGGRFTSWDGYISAKYVELVKGKKIVQSWETSEWPEGYPPSRLELRFKAKGNKTELTMVHSKVPSSQVEMYTGGWFESYWDPLKKYFERAG